MKRFIETNDWNDPALRKLSQAAKHLRRYLWDNCDAAGVIHRDFDAFSFHIGEPIEEKHLTELGDWTEALNGGRLLIPSFINTQVGTPSTSVRAHIPVLKAIKFHGLVRSGELYHQSAHSLCEEPCLLAHRHKDKEQDKDRDLSKQIPPPIEAVKAHAKTLGLPDSEAIRFHGYYTSNGWRVGRNPMKSWHGALVNWRGGWRDRNGAVAQSSPPLKVKRL